MERIQFSSGYHKSRAYAPAVVTEGCRAIWLAGNPWPLKTRTVSKRHFDWAVRLVFIAGGVRQF